MTQSHHDILIIGAGIFGITAAIELRKRKYAVTILNPGTIPHPLAASTDISKVVRMEYGSDVQYMDMVDECIDGWQEWNTYFKDILYHETGFLLVCKQTMEMDEQSFEWESYRLLKQKGHHPQRVDEHFLRNNFPAINHKVYTDGFYHPRAGFAESGRVVATLVKYARQLGVKVIENQAVEHLEIKNGRAVGVKTKNDQHYSAGHLILSAGAFTPYLLPDLHPFLRSTGHPVFHVKPSRPDLFTFPRLSVFAADIANSGWYGFPLHPGERVIKVGKHGKGLLLHPDQDERIVTEQDLQQFRLFLQETFPSLVNDPIVYTRRCLYCDTLDGHFWIDRHPEIGNLTVATGGSGHGFKMAPVLGRLITAAMEGEQHEWLARFRWRNIAGDTENMEQARCTIK